jgi:hypothetical protein
VTSDEAELRERIRGILLNDWDPHNIASRSENSHTYDGYITPLLDLIDSGADEDAVVDFLKDREAESSCFPSLNTRRLVPVARKLLALRDRYPEA